MKKMRHVKLAIVSLSILSIILLISPSVFAGTFQIVVPPMREPVKPGIELKNVTGFTKLTPGKLDLKGLWGYSYTDITVVEKPDWASVTIPESTLLTPPDGEEHPFEIIVAVTTDAPAYEFATVKLNIVTGKFARVVVPWLPILNNEFNMDQAFTIQSGYLPLLTATNPSAKDGIPNSFISYKLNLKNTGNARSILTFKPQYNAIPDGWSITAPAQIYLDQDESYEVPIDVYTPREFGYIDEWAQIPMEITMRSVVDVTGASQNTTVSIPAHCVGYYAPVPGGNNPTVLFGTIFGAILIVLILIIVVIRVIRKQPFAKKLRIRKKKKEK